MEEKERVCSSAGDSRPTVCQLLHGMSVGGAEVLAYRMARQLGKNYRFVFVCLDHLGELGSALRQEGLSVTVLERRPGIDLKSALRLAKFYREERVDIVHAHQYTPFFYALSARAFKRSPPVIFTEHGRHFPDFPRRKRMFFNRVMLRADDRVVAVGQDVKRALVQNEGFPAPRVEVIYNGIDGSAFQLPAREAALAKAAIRDEIGLKLDDFIAVQVARLDHLKDHLTAIRAWGRVVAVQPRAHLLVVGEGPERNPIEAEIRAQGLERNVHVLGLRQDVRDLLLASDVCLLTSISEGIPLTLIEAFASGRPVVATDVGGVSEVVEHEKQGLLSPSKDDAQIADNMLKLVADPALRTRLGEAGRIRANTLFSEIQMHEKYDRLYANLRRNGTREIGRKAAIPVANGPAVR